MAASRSDLAGLRIRFIAPHAISACRAALGARPQTTRFTAAEAAVAAVPP